WRRASCGRQCRAPRCRVRAPAQTAPRRTRRRAGTRNATRPAARRSPVRYSSARSCEDPVQEPALRAGLGMLAVAGAIDPVATAGLVLDAEIIAYGGQFGVALPPFGVDALRPVGAAHPS